ncbi:hypothetical protein PG984_006741 [Apiospora sp. TS-2023a]
MLALGLATTTTPIMQASPSMMVIPTPGHPAPPRPSTATYPAATSRNQLSAYFCQQPKVQTHQIERPSLPLSLSEPFVALFGGSFGTGAWPAPDETLCPDIQPELIHWPELPKTACHQAADLTHTTRNRTLISPVTRCKQNDRFALSPVGPSQTTCFLMRHAMAIDKCSSLVAAK